MMVVTVMAVALHLIQTLRGNPLRCQILLLRLAERPGGYAVPVAGAGSV
jgi:hypothetical protein